MIITPEVGMPALYHPHDDDHFGAGKPLAAVITRVLPLPGSTLSVNLAIFDGAGLVQNRQNVLFWAAEDGDVPPVGGRWCHLPNWFVRVMDATQGRFTLNMGLDPNWTGAAAVINYVPATIVPQAAPAADNIICGNGIVGANTAGERR